MDTNHQYHQNKENLLPEAAKGDASAAQGTKPDTSQIQMDFSCLSVINYALEQNGLPVIQRCQVYNGSESDLHDVQLRITASPSFAKEYQRIISVIPAKAEIELKDINLVLDGEYLASLTEKAAGTFTAELVYQEKLLCSQVIPVSVLTFNEWHGYLIYPELLVSFVTPNNPAIGRIVSRAVVFLEEWTDDPSLDGYQSLNSNRVLAQAAAIYKALEEQNIVYAVPPASFETIGQKVRLCDEVLSQKLGTCLDLTLLYASCLESIGLHPLLILQRGHIFAGVWLEETTFPESVQDDASFLTKRLAEGSQVLAVVECTLFTAGRKAQFDQACKAAAYELTAQESLECFIDVKRARLNRILPLPSRVLTNDGWHIERETVEESHLTAAPQQVSAPIDLSQAEKQEFTKKGLWERKLLDLGLRNPLLNLRLTKTVIPLLSHSLDDLEDAIAAGDDYSVHARPAGWIAGEHKSGFEAFHLVDSFHALLQSEFQAKRLRSALTEAELAAALKNLYRSARTNLEENGVNTLYLALGLLKWYETDRSTQARYAPLLLIPVEMVRKSAAEGYVIRLRDDDVQMNTTLLEKLRQDYSIEIPGLDPLPLDQSGVDTRRVFAVVRHGILQQKRWDVLESACLGIFSFSRFVMWNDIHNRAEDLSRSKIVRSLMEGHLTWQAEEMKVDGLVPEDQVLLPIPADSSQLFAIESAASEKSFVLHGPPGTGKSQTITALIANVLAQGKTVLFVAEKMAALEVVQKRLADMGLSPFCLELHSNKAKKRDVLDQLRQASEVTHYQSSDAYAASSVRISALRGELNKYAAALHQQQTCGKSLYVLINEYQSVQDAPDISGFSAESFSERNAEELVDRKLLVDKLIAAGRAAGHPHAHPLSEVQCKVYSQQLRREAGERSAAYKEQIAALRAHIDALSDALNQGAVHVLRDVERLSSMARYLTSFSSFPDAWVKKANPEEYLADVRSLASHKRSMKRSREELMEHWTESFLEMDGQELLDCFREQSEKWFLGKFFGMRSLRKRLASAAKGSLSDDALGEDFSRLIGYQKERDTADALFAKVGNELGPLYRRNGTDWAQLSALAEQAQAAFRAAPDLDADGSLRRSYGTRGDVLALAKEFQAAWDSTLQTKTAFYELLDPRQEEREDWIASELDLCDRVGQHTDKLREWVVWNKAAAEAEEAGLAPLVQAYRAGLDHDSVAAAYQKALLRSLVTHAIESDERLNQFSGIEFNEKIVQFRKLDRELTELARSEVYCRLAAQVPNFTEASVRSSETGILQRAIRSGGRGLSIRRLFEQIPNLLPRLCPCMLMSPLSVAQYLDPNRDPFDLVVFDEASQLPTSKAIGALARGKDAIIVGDPKQMPPTSFFASNTTDEEHLDEEDMESILDDCLALNMPQTHLLWHYRSRHESLIAFSNSRFYENQLYTFPSVNDRESRVHLVHVDGVFERGGKRTNLAEAQAVVRELKRRAHDPACYSRSVGVVTFNISQQNLIDDLLTETCKEDTLLDQWAFQSNEPVFIKNLENVQGDERDVILFSIGYGPDQDGRVSMNFGPLNREGGWRRLNVAVSRARYEMIVFATLTPDQIDLSRTSAEGVAALKEFLSFAAGRPLAETEESVKAAAVGGVSDSICKALGEQGYETDRSIGESAFKIDIGVIDPKHPERYLLGILLDGAGYERAKTVRDREIAQIDVLRGLGWNIVRIWSVDWWDSSTKELQRLLELLHAAEEAAAAQDFPSPEPDNPKSEPDQLESIPNLGEEPKEQEPETGERRLEVAIPAEDGMLKGLVRDAADEHHPILSYQAAELPLEQMNANDFITSAPRHRRKVIQKVSAVLSVESPISESLLTRRVVQSYSIARSGKRIQQFMEEIYASLSLQQTTQAGERIFWAKSQDPRSYDQFRANGEGECKRSAKDIPVQEAANAVCRALKEQFSLPQEDLIRSAANLMGFSRIGPAVKVLFLGAISWASQEDKIQKASNGNWVLM